MTHTSHSRIGATIMLVGGLFLSTTVLAQTGGPGGSVNGGLSVSPMSNFAVPGPAAAPALPNNTVPSAAPVGDSMMNESAPGTYGGMGPTTSTRWYCNAQGTSCRPAPRSTDTPQ